MSALVAMMPEERTGLVILTNLDGNDLTYALMYRVFDAYLKRPAKDWSAILLKADRELGPRPSRRLKNRETTRVAGTSPSLPLERYAGTYHDSVNGDAEVRKEKGRARAAVRDPHSRPLPLAVRHLPGDLAAAPAGKIPGHLHPRWRRQGR